ncbi:class I SAM-dependent methyltransferase [Halobacteriovorax sp. GB3]|uniref:class I SAM-dependent methyltransferase n=1 Tax=Halobacteriovorax sp. GB3 TaxID=2719615 RepID=UPI00235DDCCE|nr:class I SAM-dependent methyltransferase [Halobacteriovorax sp. GB3]MDD0852809.1 class I SAM-dependent methyltransferase [Halobacteriovorax sp. GB3]
MDNITLFVSNEDEIASCQKFVELLKLPYEVEVTLCANEITSGLFYKEPESISYLSQSGDSIAFDFVKLWNYHSKKNYTLKKEPLAKAIGRTKEPCPKIIDATCGSGKDSLLMLSFGAKIIAYERVPTIHLLLQTALHLAYKADGPLSMVLKERFELRYGEFQIGDVESSEYGLYYDPMYPSEPKKRKAKPRKEMVIFHEIMEGDQDVDDKIDGFLNSEFKRVILKRPIKEKKIKNPSMDFAGKSTRYDVYLTGKK